jgi:predicted DNA-binding antitoxin AbrB/MazE fold protein
MVAMTRKVPAIYENGVLRPLQPLTLPERTRVQVQIQELSEINDTASHRRAVSSALVAAGLSREATASAPPTSKLADERRDALAYRFAEKGPVSTLIVAEREDAGA